MSFGQSLEFTRRELVYPVRSPRISSPLIGLLAGTYLLVLAVGHYIPGIGVAIVLEAGLL